MQRIHADHAFSSSATHYSYLVVSKHQQVRGLIRILTLIMATEKDDQGLFNVDEPKTTFGSDFGFTQRAANGLRWLLLILPTVISLLALVAIIVAIVIFSSTSNNQGASLQARVAELEAAMSQNPTSQTNAPTNTQSQKTYIRWGNSSCPDINGTSLLYTGFTGGTAYFNRGGGANQLCMPLDPEYTLPTEPGIQSNSLVYGSEYEAGFLGSQNENVPCAVCVLSTRSEVVMIPAKTSCPDTWTREYYGYLMSENHGNYRTHFVCVDRGMEYIANYSGHADACDLWLVEASCVSLPCPPYDPQKELGCVVCSK